MKNVFCIFLSFLLIFILSFSCFAVNYTTDSDLTASSTQVSNLLSLRSNSEVLKDYVIIRTENEYCLFISDNFSVVGDNISSTDVTLIGYRSNNYPSGGTRYYRMQVPEIDIIKNHVVVSNFLEDSSKVNNTEWHKHIIIILCCIFAILIFWVIRRFK